MIDLVSVIIPTYNRSALLPRAIDSVAGQTVPTLEIIVVDDGSTDDTAGIVARQQRRDPRIHLLQHAQNCGAQAARNTGIKAARGRWLAFLDSDDEWVPHRLAAGLDTLQSSGNMAVHSDCYVTNGDDPTRSIEGIPPLSGNIATAIMTEPGPMYQGLLTERVCIQSIGYLDETIVSYQEWDTYIRLAQLYVFSFIPDPLFIYHCHSGKTISQDMALDADGYGQVVDKHHQAIREIAGEAVLRQHYRFLAEKNRIVGRDDLARHFEQCAATV